MRSRPSSRLFVLELTLDWLSEFLVCATSIPGYVAISLLELKFDRLSEFLVYAISIPAYVAISLFQAI